GKTPKGIAAQYAGFVPALEEVQTLQSALDPAESVTEDWDEYLKTTQGLLDAYEAGAETTSGPELTKANAALEEALSATYPPADALGLTVCTFTPEPTVVETEMENPETFDLPKPTNTVEQAAKTFLAAVGSGDCERIKAEANSDVGELKATNCEYLSTTYGGLDVVGTQSYGPVALAEFGGPKKDPRNGTVEFVIDSDGKLKYASESVIVGGGIHPPNEGFDAQETMDTAVDSIKNEDGDAFLSIQGPDSKVEEVDDPFLRVGSEESGKIVATAIRENPDVDAVMIGANQAAAYFIFDTDDQDFLLETGHSPGSETEYRNFGYWGLPAS
ncbi:MAG: hypothetical protein ACSLFI_10410, partial [Solirubrobacterales bacterium]